MVWGGTIVKFPDDEEHARDSRLLGTPAEFDVILLFTFSPFETP